MEEKEDNMSIEELEDSDLREKLALIDQIAIENKRDKDNNVDDLDDELEDDYDDGDIDDEDFDESMLEEEGSDF